MVCTFESKPEPVDEDNPFSGYEIDRHTLELSMGVEIKRGDSEVWVTAQELEKVADCKIQEVSDRIYGVSTQI